MVIANLNLIRWRMGSHWRWYVQQTFTISVASTRTSSYFHDICLSAVSKLIAEMVVGAERGIECRPIPKA